VQTAQTMALINIKGVISAAISAKLKARQAARSTPTTKQISAAAKADPSVYAEEVFGLTVWTRQREVLTAVRDHDRVSVRSGHKVSKSTSAAVVVWWFTSDPDARPEARAIVTAPTGRQVSEIVWREVIALHSRAARRGYKLPQPGQRPGTGVRWGDGREIIGFTIDEQQPEAIAGFSGAHLQFVLDEASGIDDRVFEALDGNAAAGARFFLISNPTRTSGAFYESQQPCGDYTPLHISSEQSPNITGESRIPGLATREWRDKMVAKYGADSLWVAVRVRGEFPSGADDEVFGAGLVSAAMHRAADGTSTSTDPLVCGLDVAGFGGDENILAPRRGLRTLPLVQIPAGESVDIAAAAIRASRKLRRDAHERVQINVDANGVGAGVYSVLVSDAFEHDGERFVPRDEIVAVAVMTAERAHDASQYANRRSELHFIGRDYLRDGGSLPDDDELSTELRAPRYALDRTNRIQVELKAKIRARLGRSPDRGDAWLLSLHEEPVVERRSARSGHRR
jgi:phage terminase large subunit